MRLTIIILIVLLLLLQYKLWLAPGGIFPTFRLTRMLALQKKENEKIQQRNSILIANIESFKNDRNAIEAAARTELNMVKHGETYYQIITPNGKKK
jgi:cell division protein FtsB